MIDIFIILLFIFVPAAILYVGYHKFKRKMIRKTTEAVVNKLPDPEEPVILHGHDLNKWNYLGYTRCQYVNENGKITSEYPIFLFVSKNDMKRRSYYMNSEYAEKNHTFVSKFVKPWAAGEGEIYQLICNEGNMPGDFLKEYMLEHFSSEWDTETNWWGSSDNAKYTAANNKQKRERDNKTPPNQDSGGKKDPVVIQVDFGKQA